MLRQSANPSTDIDNAADQTLMLDGSRAPGQTMDTQFALGVLLRVERMGTFRNLAGLLSRHAPGIAIAASSTTIDSLSALTERVDDALALEAVWGDGSLINLADPLVEILIRRGRALSAEQIANARIYRLRLASSDDTNANAA